MRWCLMSLLSSPAYCWMSRKAFARRNATFAVYDGSCRSSVPDPENAHGLMQPAQGGLAAAIEVSVSGHAVRLQLFIQQADANRLRFSSSGVEKKLRFT